MIAYVTVDELLSYTETRGITLTGDPQTLLWRASDWLELQAFAGRRTDPDQEYEWPRTGIRGVDPDIVPAKIKTAQLVAAILQGQGVDLLAPVGPRVTSESVVGAVAVTYANDGPLTQYYPQLMALLRDYQGGGGMQFTVRRA